MTDLKTWVAMHECESFERRGLKRASAYIYLDFLLEVAALKLVSEPGVNSA